jgi:S1-C subfamily serine protease
VLLLLAMLAAAGLAFAGILLLFGSSAQSSGVSSPPRAWLGVDIAGSLPAGFLSFNGGVLIAAVAPGSPAAAAGLEPGDVITQIGSRPVAAPSDIDSAIAAMHAGQRVQIHYQRGPEAYTTLATLAARPANP